MFFIGDDGSYYEILPSHPNLRAGEPGLKYTNTPVPEGKEEDGRNYWAVRALTPREVEILIQKEG